jgi:Plasmid encoded RepA protein
MGQIHQLIFSHGIEAARAHAVDKAERQAVEAAFGVLSDEKGRIGITHAGFAMAALPHKNTLETIWKKDAGTVRLLVESGHDADGTPVGIPYGSIARMILLYLQTQAVRTRSREVELGTSMNAWLGAMDIPAGGKTYQIVREQSRRLSRCRLTFFRRTDKAEMVTNGAFVRDAILPLDSTAAQLPLWQERVRLDEGFYQSLIDHPLPLREEAVRQISSRSMAIDFYVWLAYRLHALSEPLAVPWAALKGQFGQSYSAARKFRRDAITNLALALAVYPEARVVIDGKDGLLLYPSPPPVPERKMLRA